MTSVYEGLRWVRPEKRVRLDPETAMQLRAAGITMVRVKVGWGKEREVSLQYYLDRYGSARRQG
ncbi:hypothetical protein LQ938_02960 [Microbacterium sp. cx-55]|uniref:hypothetical protein n=1 Tax=unclassified Microbacterium TaxID=2609290 RepID=UPI001CC1797E|nr:MULTISPECIES: hypothetical protein [unclassified Microbacterium]MBZ4486849.1 hypothetical protein [Microbacterium sp. cx-55]MCC4908086.1 hypothetical protein [Microbacterium sp. cx-59]UGB35777.1 hypothetical protein LQ938_02960 [Microbacterium sp. cx-55]